MMLDYLTITLLAILALAMSVWYFRKRRELIRFISDIAKELEDVLKPEDKIYELLGYLVGFKAKFKLGRSTITNAYITLTTIPTYSLLYYPIAKIMSRRNLLGMALEFRRGVPRDLHLLIHGRMSGKYEEMLKRDVPYLTKLMSSELDVLGSKYKAYYEDRKDLEVVVKELTKHNLRLVQFSIFKSKGLIYVLTEAKRGIIADIYDLITSVYRELHKSLT